MEEEENLNSKLGSAKASLIRKLERSLGKVTKSILCIDEQISKSLQWKLVEHEAVLLQSNLYRYKLGMAALEVEDWESEGKLITLQLDPLKSASDQITEKVRISRKLERGIEPLQKHRKNLQFQQDTLKSYIVKIEGIETEKELAALDELITPPKKPYIPKEERPKALPYHVFWSASGLKIVVGKKAKGNGIVTFKIAKGNDFWFHAAGAPGAHVILQSTKGQEPDAEALLDALQMALAYSDIKDPGGGDIVSTQRKFLQPLGKKELGKVQVSKHKICNVKRDLKRVEEIKKRTR